MCACTQSHTGRWLDEGGDKTCLFSCHALCVSSLVLLPLCVCVTVYWPSLQRSRTWDEGAPR